MEMGWSSSQKNKILLSLIFFWFPLLHLALVLPFPASLGKIRLHLVCMNHIIGNFTSLLLVHSLIQRLCPLLFNDTRDNHISNFLLAAHYNFAIAKPIFYLVSMNWRLWRRSLCLQCINGLIRKLLMHLSCWIRIRASCKHIFLLAGPGNSFIEWLSMRLLSIWWRVSRFIL